MARQEIILGIPPKGEGGDPPRTASMKINAMTEEVYDKLSALGTAAEASVTRSSTDTTAGRVTKVGDFGLGSNAAPAASGFNAIPASGDWSFNPSTPNVDLVGGNYGIIQHGAYEISTGNWVQLIQKMHEPRAYIRGSINGSVSATAELFSSFNAQYDPQLSGGLMSSAVVNGWLVEKFLNGTAIVSGTYITATLPASTQSTVTFAIPSIFVGEVLTCPLVTLIPRSNSDCYATNAFMTNGTTTVAVYIRNGVTAQVFDLRVKIVGRWK